MFESLNRSREFDIVLGVGGTLYKSIKGGVIAGKGDFCKGE